MSITRKPTQLSKRIAGVRLPKKLRTMGGNLVDIMSKPLIAALVTPVLIAGAVALRNNKAVRAAAVKASGRARRAVHNLSKRTGKLTKAVGAGQA